MGTETTDDDDALFRAEMDADGVVPIKPAARASLTAPRPRPVPVKRLEDESAVPGESMQDTSGWDADIDTGDLITFLRQGLPGEILRKLKRGHWVVQATLDLHGETVAGARDALPQFLSHARHHGLRCVSIIHGKGYRSPGSNPVLRNKVRLSLSQRDVVLAFCDAAPADGGSGAVLVLLKSG